MPVSYEAYRYVDSLTFPQNGNGERPRMVHKNLQDNDVKVLRKGDPIFTLLGGSEMTYGGYFEAWPHFINEATLGKK